MRYLILAIFYLSLQFFSFSMAAQVEVVESYPLDTTLDIPEVRNAFDVWMEFIRGAKTSIDTAQFYLSNKEDESLEKIVQEMINAANRGVKIRILTDKKMYATYPETVDRFERTQNIQTKIIDFKKLSNGILHAKYFIIDGNAVFVGSQNFDWRALSHIHETGLYIKSDKIARSLKAVFDKDWSKSKLNISKTAVKSSGKISYPSVSPNQDNTKSSFKIDDKNIELVASPFNLNPKNIASGEAKILDLISDAKQTIIIQLLSYSPVSYSGEFYPKIDNALRAAAVKGVKIKMILSDWCKSHPAIDHIKSLSLIPNIEIKLSTIPLYQNKFVPFSRVEHSKYMVIDAKTTWVGTSNWSKDYFYSSRNVDISVIDDNIAAVFLKIFNNNWKSSYTYFVDVKENYIPPKISGEEKAN